MPTLAHAIWNRAAFGPRPGDLAAFEALGADDAERLEAWLAEQLNPDPDEAADPEVHARRNGLAGHPDPGFVTLGKTLGQLWVDHRLGGIESSRPAAETRLLTLMRMTHSKWQLRERLCDFWMNHLNVYGFETYTQETLVHWDRDVIRPHLFGNFRELLEASARSVTMLYYLDNYTNTRSGPNENYARELIELHTLGAENYFGVGGQAGVPDGDPWPAGAPSAGQPAPAGYVDADVYEAARCLTGWGVNGADGSFLYNDANHDHFQKAILSKGNINFLANQAQEEDALELFDLLAAHPGTGRHIARKLCRRLLADEPPETLVDSVGQLFTNAWQDTDQLKQVYEAILTSPEFAATWGEKIKRPVDWLVSALRATEANLLFGYTSQNPLTIESDTNSMLFRLGLTGQTLFSRVPPDGYPDRAAAWSGSNPRVQCWRLAGWIVDQDLDGVSGTDDFRADVIGTTINAGVTTANAIVDFWLDRILGREIEPGDREILVDFMAEGGNPANPIPLNVANSSNRQRLRMLVALILMSPDFFLE